MFEEGNCNFLISCCDSAASSLFWFAEDLRIEHGKNCASCRDNLLRCLQTCYGVTVEVNAVIMSSFLRISCSAF